MAKGKILIVDDDPDFVAYTRTILESQDYDRVIVEQETVVEVREHGGALYWPFLAGLMGMGIWRKLSRPARR